MAKFRNVSTWMPCTWLLGAVLAAGTLAGGGGCERQPEPVGGGDGEASPEHALVGEPAPPFTAQLLDGSEVELEDHAGDVLLLDFWATWCPPCIEGLPKVARVASELRDEGVVFYAINVGEDGEEVEDFLRQQDLDVPVLMDREGEIAGAYQADAIPQTVLIGRDGTVQAVHVGLSADMEATLQQQLRSLVGGEHLAPG